uniref:RIKEN cDNA 4930524B15 gene n=1 Tax=Mus spicilegus TaxID=10103 RepID=A0A8C6HZJ3_MUSSI
MVPSGSGQRPDGPRLIYVTRFASHRHGVWQLRGLRGFGHRGPGLGARSASKQAAVEPGAPGGERPTGSQAGVTDTPDSAPFQRRSRAPRGREQAAQAGLNQKNAAKEFDFPIPLNEASKLMKERKKASVWSKVQQVISRMIAENESYRRRLQCQRVSSEIRVAAR